MFNGKGYNLSDIAAVTGNGRNGDGMFGDNGWWIILLFLFTGWGGNGFGGNRDSVAYGFDINNLENGIRGLEHGICDGFYDMNTSLLTGFGNVALGSIQNTNAITGQLANMAAESAACCCETQRLIERGLCEINYNILTQSNATNTNIANAARDIIENNNLGVRSILDFLTQDKIATLTAENQGLRLAASQAAQNAYLVGELRPCPVPAYTVPNPYCCNTYVNTCGF